MVLNKLEAIKNDPLLEIQLAGLWGSKKTTASTYPFELFVRHARIELASGGFRGSHSSNEHMTQVLIQHYKELFFEIH